jgi:hypothetical protein
MIEVNPTDYSDAALGNGPKGQSITGEIVKLNEKVGHSWLKLLQDTQYVIIIRRR